VIPRGGGPRASPPQHEWIVLDLPENLLQRRFLALLEEQQPATVRRIIDTDDRDLPGVDQVVTRVTDDAQVVVVVGASWITPWNDMVDVQSSNTCVTTDLAAFF